MTTTLHDDATGTYLVTTESSSYVLDLTNRAAARLPGTGAGALEGLAPVAVAELRHDGAALPLVQLGQCEVGAPMVLLLDVRGDGVRTLRLTNSVCSIEQLDDQADEG